MPRYKLSPEERALEQKHKENLRNIMKGLDVKNFDDLKAVDEQTALSELDSFDEKWSSKYPKIAISWRANWANLST